MSHLGVKHAQKESAKHRRQRAEEIFKRRQFSIGDIDNGGIAKMNLMIGYCVNFSCATIVLSPVENRLSKCEGM